MKWMRSSFVAVLLVGLATVAMAADQLRTYQLKNRLRIEYDDNIYETAKNQTDSFKIIEELELLANLNFEQTFLGLRYRPTYVWWDDREPDDDDFHHDADVVFSHAFTPRLSLNLKDLLRIAEQPEQIDRGNVIREKDDYLYNVADGIVTYLLRPGTRLDAAGRYTILRYDRQEVADLDDYDIVAGGLTLRQELSPRTVLLGEYRLEDVAYEADDRGSSSDYLGVGLEKTFSPNLLGNARAGLQMKSYEDDAIDDGDDPYFEGSITYLPSPATRLTAGLGYSLYEADVYPFANQERTVGYISLAHDLTARVSLYGAASYAVGEYNADEAIAGTVVVDEDENEEGEVVPVFDGDETTTQLSARASYKLNRDNWLELGWQYLDLESDYRSNYDRNRIELGWRTQL